MLMSMLTSGVILGLMLIFLMLMSMLTAGELIVEQSISYVDFGINVDFLNVNVDVNRWGIDCRTIDFLC